MRALVFDIGGSQLRAGLWNGNLERRLARPSPGVEAYERDGIDPVEDLLARVRSLGEELLDGQEPPDAVGVAFPGPVDSAGRIDQAPTHWGARSPHL